MGNAVQHLQKVAAGQAHVCEMRWLTQDGEIRWLRDYAKPVFDPSGKRVVRIYGASQDISARKRMEMIQTPQYNITRATITEIDLPALFAVIRDELQ